MYRKISFRSVPKPGRETAPGFSLRGRGAQNLPEGAAENIAKRAAQLAEEGNVAAIRICMNRLSPVAQHNPVAFELPAHPLDAGLAGRGGRERDRRQAAGGAHDCARQGAPRGPLLLRFVEALSTPPVAPVMGLFGGRRGSLFVNPFKKVTKAPCKFHLLQGACSSPVVCSTPCSCPVVYRVTGCGACVPEAMQHGRSVLLPLDSLSRTSAAAMMHCRSGTLQSSGVS
jgi:hypothetical protein